MARGGWQANLAICGGEVADRSVAAVQSILWLAGGAPFTSGKARATKRR